MISNNKQTKIMLWCGETFRKKAFIEQLWKEADKQKGKHVTNKHSLNIIKHELVKKSFCATDFTNLRFMTTFLYRLPKEMFLFVWGCFMFKPDYSLFFSELTVLSQDRTSLDRAVSWFNSCPMDFPTIGLKQFFL